MRLALQIAGTRVRQMRNSYKILIGKHAGKKSLSKPSLRLQYNIKINRMVGCGLGSPGTRKSQLRISGP
jgi:hypothetical protein